MTSSEHSIIFLVLSFCLLGSAENTSARGQTPRDELNRSPLKVQRNLRPNEWSTIPGGVGTTCADGTSYSFFVRPGNRDHLLIYLQGGSACWSASSCDPSRTLYRPNLQDVDPSTELGIFDFGNLENPFRNYTVVFIPYCSGDMHLGDRTATYRSPASDALPDNTLDVQHKGFANATSGLRWAFANVKAPKSVFVSGGSAGAIASPFYAGRVREHYKRAVIVQLGDSAGGFRLPVIPKLLAGWGSIDLLRKIAPYRTLNPETINFQTLYQIEGRRQPSIMFSQVNNSQDARQLFGLRLFGAEKVDLLQLLELSYSDIHNVVPNFRTFTAAGDLHVILDRPEFYTLAVNGVRLRDWVADLASGRPVNDVPPAAREGYAPGLGDGERCDFCAALSE